jgi:hypothetical protein
MIVVNVDSTTGPVRSIRCAIDTAVQPVLTGSWGPIAQNAVSGARARPRSPLAHRHVALPGTAEVEDLDSRLFVFPLRLWLDNDAVRVHGVAQKHERPPSIPSS